VHLATPATLRHPEQRPTGVLFTSGHTEWTLERHGTRVEPVALLEKAFTPSELLCRVRELLDG
jgi:DNA-binding response OmpR family regulator